MAKRIEDFRLKSLNELPDFPERKKLAFTWLVTKRGSEYWSVVTLKDQTPVFEEMAYSCDGKYFSHSQNHYQEICGWLKKKYKNRLKSIELVFQDYDCGCYFID